MKNNKKTNLTENIGFNALRIINDPSLIPIFFHKQKSLILKLLITKEMTLKEIRDKTNLNPGTIKRHLDELISLDLVYLSRTEISPYGIIMKFYRSKALKFKILIDVDFP